MHELRPVSVGFVVSVIVAVLRSIQILSLPLVSDPCGRPCYSLLHFRYIGFAKGKEEAQHFRCMHSIQIIS